MNRRMVLFRAYLKAADQSAEHRDRKHKTQQHKLQQFTTYYIEKNMLREDFKIVHDRADLM